MTVEGRRRVNEIVAWSRAERSHCACAIQSDMAAFARWRHIDHRHLVNSKGRVLDLLDDNLGSNLVLLLSPIAEKPWLSSCSESYMKSGLRIRPIVVAASESITVQKSGRVYRRRPDCKPPQWKQLDARVQRVMAGMSFGGKFAAGVYQISTWTWPRSSSIWPTGCVVVVGDSTVTRAVHCSATGEIQEIRPHHNQHYW
jgi:hypothetical protein